MKVYIDEFEAYPVYSISDHGDEFDEIAFIPEEEYHWFKDVLEKYKHVQKRLRELYRGC